jgi:hypothetical protein
LAGYGGNIPVACRFLQQVVPHQQIRGRVRPGMRAIHPHTQFFQTARFISDLQGNIPGGKAPAIIVFLIFQLILLQQRSG